MKKQNLHYKINHWVDGRRSGKKVSKIAGDKTKRKEMKGKWTEKDKPTKKKERKKKSGSMLF